MKPATPLPWYQAGDNELGEGVLGQGSGRYIAIMADERQAEDYDYLVHACNSYPRLERENARLRVALGNARSWVSLFHDEPANVCLKEIDAALKGEESTKGSSK